MPSTGGCMDVHASVLTNIIINNINNTDDNIETISLFF